MSKVGVWIVGASGSVATTAMAGAVALAKRQAKPTALVTALPQFRKVKFCGFDSMVFGGHEIREPDLLGELKALHANSGLLSPEIIKAAAPAFRRIKKRIRPGTVIGCGKPVEAMATLKLIAGRKPADVVRKIRRDLEDFQKASRCDRLVVLNLSSTEPPFKRLACHRSLAALKKALAKPGPSPLPASSLTCMAALELGAAYLNFTPSLGPDVPAFASWVGHNIFGNRDADVLDDPVNKASKIKSKDHLVQSIVGYSPETLVTIEKISSMGDWKTAWDHIHYEGFLGTKMVMQFLWQGCDSILAAPLALDLVRLAALALDRGESGVMGQTACFFKSPLGTGEQDMFKQFQALETYLNG